MKITATCVCGDSITYDDLTATLVGSMRQFTDVGIWEEKHKECRREAAGDVHAAMEVFWDKVGNCRGKFTAIDEVEKELDEVFKIAARDSRLIEAMRAVLVEYRGGE